MDKYFAELANSYFIFDHEAVLSSEIKIDGVPDFNLIYEFAGRTATMAIVSIFIMYSQNVKLFIVMFLMNLLREIQETIIDPLFPLTNAPPFSDRRFSCSYCYCRY